VETTARPAKPDTIDTHPQPPMTKAMLAWRAVWIASALAACLIFAYSPSVGAKAAVLAGSALIALVLFWRRFLDR
jgi:hypothetical protein